MPSALVSGVGVQFCLKVNKSNSNGVDKIYKKP
jgi:hypothetical protein